MWNCASENFRSYVHLKIPIGVALEPCGVVTRKCATRPPRDCCDRVCLLEVGSVRRSAPVRVNYLVGVVYSQDLLPFFANSIVCSHCRQPSQRCLAKGSATTEPLMFGLKISKWRSKMLHCPYHGEAAAAGRSFPQGTLREIGNLPLKRHIKCAWKRLD